MNKQTALKISRVVLVLAGTMDLIRGYAHTYNVRYAAENLAGIEPIPDSLVLMGAFGISNFLTGFIYFLVAVKAPKLSPYILLMIPFSYLIGGLGMQLEQVTFESAFRGRNMLAIYIPLCLLTGTFYFVLSLWERLKSKSPELRAS